ncbi:MAG: nucleotidyltransferase substrate binding protein [Anaerolineales bacterium]|nr:nucleotidyltransferase substrate binding protein [Anaerolineales bacterium]
MTLERPQQDLTHLEKAIRSFNELHERVSDEPFMAQQDDTIRLGLEAGLIKNFEFTYELCWKAMRRWLANNVSPDVVVGVTRRELFRLAAESRLIDDVAEWMTYHAARNQTSHRYGQEIAEEVFVVLGNFGLAAKRLLLTLTEKQDD